MARWLHHKQILRHIALIIAIPLALTGTGYAIFSQDLSINTTTKFPTYNYSNNMLMTYTKTLGRQGQRTVYNITMTVRNNGVNPVASWSVGFTMPSDFTSFTCQNTVVCTNTGPSATINNGTGNGTIAAGATRVFTLSFQSLAFTNYTLQNISVAGVAPAFYQPIAGLTASRTVGARTKSGKWYNWPYTFTVTNNSGSSIQGWQITAPWSSTTNRVTSMAGTVNYVTAPTQLTLLSITGLANGQSIVFNGTLGSTSQTWSLGTMVILGAY